MTHNKHLWLQKLGERRLIFFNGNPEASSGAENVEGGAKTETIKPLDPAKKEQLDKDAQTRVAVRDQHEQAENKERSETLPAIEEKIEKSDSVEKKGDGEKADEKSEKDERNDKNSQRPNEQNERQLQDAEKFVSEARDTLKDPYQKEIFDAAVNALSPQEKLAYYRDSIVWFNSCDKQSKSSTLTSADIQEINKSVFAKDVVFAAFDYNIQMSSGLRQTRDASRADYLLNVSEADRQMSDQAHEKMVEAAKKYLKEHPDVAKILERQQKEDEQKFNESASDERQWGANGEATKNNKSPEEMKKDASKELQTIIDQVNGRKGIKFELQSASQHDKETGERLSVKIIPKDQKQSEQVQEITKKIVGSFEKQKQGFVRKTETLMVTSDAQKLKECIASVVSHSYTEKKKAA